MDEAVGTHLIEPHKTRALRPHVQPVHVVAACVNGEVRSVLPQDDAARVRKLCAAGQQRGELAARPIQLNEEKTLEVGRYRRQREGTIRAAAAENQRRAGSKNGRQLEKIAAVERSNVDNRGIGR